MKRVFIIHGWTGHPDEHWAPWLSQKLEEKRFRVLQPAMPGTDFPKMNEWVSYLKDQIGSADRDTYLVGHSIGCLAILRYLEKYKESIGGAILVAPWATLTPEAFPTDADKAVVDDWTTASFNWDEIKKHCSRFLALLSEDDPDVPYVENKLVFEKHLRAKIITFRDKGHFIASAGVLTLQEALDGLLEMARQH